MARYVLTLNILNRLLSFEYGINKIHCHHCYKEIRLLTTVVSLKGKNKVKLYHNRCFKKIYHAGYEDMPKTTQF